MKRTYKEAIESILANLEMVKNAHKEAFKREAANNNEKLAFCAADKMFATQDAINLIKTETQGIES